MADEQSGRGRKRQGWDLVMQQFRALLVKRFTVTKRDRVVGTRGAGYVGDETSLNHPLFPFTSDAHTMLVGGDAGFYSTLVCASGAVHHQISPPGSQR
jgi:hypothetical protein